METLVKVKNKNTSSTSHSSEKFINSERNEPNLTS
jgi:hypothetical protein